MNLIDRFMHMYLKEVPAAPEPTASVEELDKALSGLRAANGALRVAELTEAQRQVLRGKGGPLLTAMLAGAAKGLQGAPELAQAMGVDPQVVATLLDQRMALVGAVKTLEILRARADGCWYWVTDRAQAGARRLLDALMKVLGPEEGRPAPLIVLTAYFTSALRAHEKGLQSKAAPAEALTEQKEALAQELQARKEQAEGRELVRQMLAEIAEGKGLLPAPRAGQGSDAGKGPGKGKR